ncbi:patatin-like phospholipase family protein [Lacticaseibacillus jixianensis]|uniref:Patatin-like phospholipase family protein n=1 Tax=Lacticaseibacillus jixianensis TaxID=2486012 RepID=A0ABW4BBG8_9LACO|nr:patatin-like phospholipase family protein [Lacticaseibacillus jixianensis]
MALGLVLGGGGSRGAFQAGALAALAAANVQPAFVLGTSIGAINALATTKLAPAELVQWWLTKIPRNMFWQRQGEVPYANLLRELIARPKLRPWPVLALTAALPGLHEHVVELTSKTPAAQLQWLLATSAIPYVYPKVNINGVHYVDGGVVNDMPIDIAKDLGATHIVSIGAGGLGPTPKVTARLHLDVPSWAPNILDFRQKPRPRLLLAGWQMAQKMIKSPEFQALQAKEP